MEEPLRDGDRVRVLFVAVYLIDMIALRRLECVLLGAFSHKHGLLVSTPWVALCQ